MRKNYTLSNVNVYVQQSFDLKVNYKVTHDFPVSICSIAILYLRFGVQIQDNFVAELSTHYHNYILLLCLHVACLK